MKFLKKQKTIFFNTLNIDLFITQQTACQELLNEISDIARQERIVIERYHASEKVCFSLILMSMRFILMRLNRINAM